MSIDKRGAVTVGDRGLVSLDVYFVSGGRRVEVLICCGGDLYGLTHVSGRHGSRGVSVSTGDDQGVEG